jgi:hypothetical protein
MSHSQTRQGASNESRTSTASTSTASGVGEVNFDPSAIKFLLVEAVDSSVGLWAGAEGDETESTRTTGVTIAHHNGLRQRISNEQSRHITFLADRKGPQNMQAIR